jgi:hypothetical protein
MVSKYKDKVEDFKAGVQEDATCNARTASIYNYSENLIMRGIGNFRQFPKWKTGSQQK